MKRSALLCALLTCLAGHHPTAEADDQRGCQDSTCLQPLPGFSCPPAKLWDQNGTTRQAVCVDCRGVQPRPEQRTMACPRTQSGSIVEGREYFCQANLWRPGQWQLISNSCICAPPKTWHADRGICADGDDLTSSFQIYSTGLRWSNGAEPYWNTLINKLNSAIGTDWYSDLPPNNFVRQAVDYLAAMIALPNRRCPAEPAVFGNVTAHCEIYWEDIVETPFQKGPFYVVSLWLSRS